MKKINQKLKSFTLIELLVATFIFMILITIGMAAMTVMWHSKSKLSGSKTIQEAGRLSMEMMANEVKKANGEESTYKKFIIEDSGASLEVKQNVKKVFRLEDSSGNQQDIDCPTGDTCHVAVNIDNTSWSQLTSSDVNVTKLEFSGQDGTQPPPNPYIEPYVTIEMAVQTTNQTDVNKKANANFRTTVLPSETFAAITSPTYLSIAANIFAKGAGTAQVDQGKYIETSINLSGRDSQVRWNSWTTYTNAWGRKHDCSGDNQSCYREARDDLKNQQPEIKIVKDGNPIATAYLFINRINRGKFINASMDLAGKDSQVGWPGWTTDINDWFRKFDCGDAGYDNTDCFNMTRDQLRRQNSEVKFLDSSGQNIGSAYLFVNGVNMGKFIHSSIDVSGRNSQVRWSAWTTNAASWGAKKNCSGDNTSCFNEARQALMAQNPELRLVNKFIYQWSFE